MKTILFGSSGPESGPAQIAYAGFRVFMGLSIALYRGQLHLSDLNNPDIDPQYTVLGQVQELGLPSPLLFAWAVALVETIGGVLIALGLLTRLSAAAIALIIFVAFFGAHGANLGESEQALLYAIPFTMIAVIGSGKFGIDAKLAGR